MSKSYLLGFHGWRWFGYTPSLMHWKVHTAKDGQFGACRSFRACLLLFQGPLPQNGFSEFYGISGCSNSSMIKISLVQSWFKTSALNSSKCIFIYWAYSNSILLETWERRYWTGKKVLLRKTPWSYYTFFLDWVGNPRPINRERPSREALGQGHSTHCGLWPKTPGFLLIRIILITELGAYWCLSTKILLLQNIQTQPSTPSFKCEG